jgi:O-antigen/teichoic acid export membrane protein
VLAQAKFARPSSDRHLARAISKSTVLGVLASATQVATRLVTVPIVIHHLGLGGYGIWSIIMTTVTYMRFGTAGIKSAFQKYVAEATGNGEFETASRLVSTGSISILVLSIVGLIPIALFSSGLAKHSGVPPEFLSQAASSITVLALILTVANFGAAYEAIVMGGHRIDLTRRFNIVTTIGEAIAIVVFLHFGYGLLAMAAIMGISELIYILACYVVSRRIVPEIRVRISYFTTSVFPELIRFAGSFQLVNMLEVLYLAILPIFILKFYGADSAGIYALALRVATAALVAQDALALPILSGGTVVFASGSAERMRRFLERSFKAMIAVTLPPLAFVSAFGSIVVLAWTGESGPYFGVAIALVSLAGLFKAISLLQLVLYRTTGRALLDNIRQLLRIAILLVVVLMGRRIGFYGLLVGLAVAELVGVIFMFFVMSATFKGFNVRQVARDTLRICVTTVMVLLAGFGAAMIPVHISSSVRLESAIKLGYIMIGCVLAMLPAAALTRVMSPEERTTLLYTVMPWRRERLAVETPTETGISP